MTTAVSVSPPAGALPQPETYAPSVGDWIGLALTGAVGTIALAPGLAAVAIALHLWVAVTVWVVWVVLAIAFAHPALANALGRSIAGWREPDDDERILLEHALARVCTAAGSDHSRFTLRVASGLFNAHASGRGVIATTADVLSGDFTAEDVETEAMLAHELAHHRQGDLVLTGPRWWLLLPLLPYDLLTRAVARIPFIGIPLAVLLQLPIRLLLFPIRAAWSLAGRPRELMADRFAVHCGYALPLERVLSRCGNRRWQWRGALFDWLLDTHPGPSDRITAIHNAALAASEG